jgi:predicted transcriptional regulator
VRALTDRAGVSQPAVSKHLGVLRHSGLVRDRRDGRQTHYSAEPQGLTPLIDWMGLYSAFWRDRFDRLEDLLNGPMTKLAADTRSIVIEREMPHPPEKIWRAIGSIFALRPCRNGTA